MDGDVVERWQAFVAQQVRAGHFSSERDVVEASMALVRERQAKLDALRATLEVSEARGGRHSADDARRAIKQAANRLRAARA